MKRSTSYHLLIVAALLLLQFFIRAHQPTLQDPYLDEGFHIKRASIAWDFEMNPGRFSHGKLLLYYWLGIFEAAPDIALPTSRLGVALFSLITGSTLYAIGRRMAGPAVGMLALGLYAILPSAFFYERMAMADPLTTGFAALTAWRSLIFARKPQKRDGIMLGILIALGTLTKLTMGALPAIPVAAALIYTPWRWKTLRSQAGNWLRDYVPPLIIAAVIVALIWSPILIPAYLARDTDDPFLIVDSDNLRTSDRSSSQEYVDKLSLLVSEVTSPQLWIGIYIAAGLLLIFRQTRRNVLFLIVWLLVILVPPFVAAQLVTLRYFMPAGAPLVLLLAMVWHVPREFHSKPFEALAELWNRLQLQWTVRGALIVGLVIWAAFFALPFVRTDLTAPEDLDFSDTNYTEYQSGYLSGDDAVRSAANTLNSLNPPGETLYANWWLCHLFYFYVDRDVVCLDHHTPRSDLALQIRRDAPPGTDVYLALSGYQPFFESLTGVCSEPIAEYKHPHIKNPAWSVRIWRLWQGSCKK